MFCHEICNCRFRSHTQLICNDLLQNRWQKQHVEKPKGWCTTLNLKNTQNILVSPWQHAKNNHKCTLNNQNTPTTFKKQVERLSYNWSEPKLPNNHMKQNRFSEHLYNCIATHTHTHPPTHTLNSHTHSHTHTQTHTHTHTQNTWFCNHITGLITLGAL